MGPIKYDKNDDSHFLFCGGPIQNYRQNIKVAKTGPAIEQMSLTVQGLSGRIRSNHF
jgi:hypothetical protein